MFALVDCNNFFASCEQLFDPKLQGRPLVVLSNNDGCVVSRSAEARTLGVAMGAPWHQLRDLARRQGLLAVSSNFALYADMSRRVVETLRSLAPALEVYSIDEAFIDLSQLGGDRVAFGLQLRQRVRSWTGLPVCVGIASTKTLAKLANHIAKKALLDTSGVCDLGLLGEPERARLMATIEVGEIWGVGRQLGPRLQALGLASVDDLRRADPAWVGRRFSVMLERTVRELQGQPCQELQPLEAARQQIVRSRTFGGYVRSRDELAQAVSSHIGQAAEKLRRQGSVAAAVGVFIRTNPHRDAPQHTGSLLLPLARPSADTRVLTAQALRLLRTIYRDGYDYRKAGVLLSGLTPARQSQPDLFSAGDDPRSAALMRTLDQVNARWGSGSLKLSSCGVSPAWGGLSQRRSPAYTTRWDQLPTVLAS